MSVVATASGAVEGALHRGVERFAGIPYAAPPVGEFRFAPPRPAAPWRGVRPAEQLGPISLQNEAPMLAALGGPERTRSEDCLALTVYTPRADDALRPVMVWIHGGGFLTGAGDTPISDGSTLAARGDVVVVTVGYRLGALGFLYLGEMAGGLASSGCNGILDQIAALEWVRDNIGAFGGDPANVTVFGASAGAMSIAVLLTVPQARGLFRRAILQSGAGESVLTPEMAAERTHRFCELAGAATVDELRVLDAGVLLIAQAALAAETKLQSADEPYRWSSQLPFLPVVDGDGLAPVDLVLGTTDEEWRLFSFAAFGPAHDAELVRAFGDELVRAYRARLGSDAPAPAVYDALMTDAMFRLPMHRFADDAVAAGSRVWLYRFGYRTPVLDGTLGSCHSLDVPFVFDRREGPIEKFVGEDAPDALAAAMQQAWIAFARAGDPNHDAIPLWPPQRRDRRSVLRFDTCVSVVDDTEASDLARWASVI